VLFLHFIVLRNGPAQPFASEHLACAVAELWFSNEGHIQKLGKSYCLLFVNFVFDLHNDAERVVAERWHSAHCAIFVEVFMPFGAAGYEVGVESSDELLDLGEMVVVFAPVVGFAGLEQQIPCEHFVHHAGEGPYVRGLVVTLAEDDLRGAILSSLDLSRKVVVEPAGIAEICDFDAKWFL
jgi:hypothetical protein